MSGLEYVIKPMDPKSAHNAANWEYPPPYSIYNMTPDAETMAEMMSGYFYSVYKGQEMVGYYCFGKYARVPWAEEHHCYARGHIDIGLAMRPDLIGQGLGLDFFSQGVHFAHTAYPGLPVRLTVAVFNSRAQKVYARAGFKTVGGFTVPGGLEFQIMLESPES